jgi:hypothetical protein
MTRRAFFILLAASAGTCAAFAADDDARLSRAGQSMPEQAGVKVATEVAPMAARRFKHAAFEQEKASRDARAVADWVVDSGDSRGLPFAIIDKKDAKVFVFSATGKLHGAGPALLGLAIGDDAVPGIGNRPLSTIRPAERTTPAGRFVATLDFNLKGKEILWVDYAGAVSLHPVAVGTPAERRQQRLASPTPLDNRISYGCINVPARFFETVVHPAFTGTSGIVYVLPETRSAQDLFGAYDVEEATVVADRQPGPEAPGWQR